MANTKHRSDLMRRAHDTAIILRDMSYRIERAVAEKDFSALTTILGATTKSRFTKKSTP